MNERDTFVSVQTVTTMPTDGQRHRLHQLHTCCGRVPTMNSFVPLCFSPLCVYIIYSARPVGPAESRVFHPDLYRFSIFVSFPRFSRILSNAVLQLLERYSDGPVYHLYIAVALFPSKGLSVLSMFGYFKGTFWSILLHLNINPFIPWDRNPVGRLWLYLAQHST
jgi:hypothetical protein